MASRAMYWRSVASRAGANRWLTTTTTPKMRSAAPASANFGDHQHGFKLRALMKGEYAPIYIQLGLVALAAALGTHSAKQHLMHSPAVRVSKKKREIVAEVEDPDRVKIEAKRFIGKSFLRKVAHLQDFDSIRSGIPDPTRPNPFNNPCNVETLETVGVNPRGRC